jgi:hypothetical protein
MGWRFKSRLGASCHDVRSCGHPERAPYVRPLGDLRRRVWWPPGPEARLQSPELYDDGTTARA